MAPLSERPAQSSSQFLQTPSEQTTPMPQKPSEQQGSLGEPQKHPEPVQARQMPNTQVFPSEQGLDDWQHAWLDPPQAGAATHVPLLQVSEPMQAAPFAQHACVSPPQGGGVVEAQ